MPVFTHELAHPPAEPFGSPTGIPAYPRREALTRDSAETRCFGSALNDAHGSSLPFSPDDRFWPAGHIGRAERRLPATRSRQREQHTRGFASTIAGLGALADWLQCFGVTLVGMEATGIYWRTVFDALEPRFLCWLLNARHLRTVPGRKSDVIDTAWICQLVEHGLVRPSFVPAPEIHRLRNLTRSLSQSADRGAHAGDPAAGE
jgi:Transposase